MTQKDNGGAEFPYGNWEQGGESGVTLRDWFAGQALTGIVGVNYDWFTSGTETGSRTHEAAAFAYSLADALLAARSAK